LNVIHWAKGNELYYHLYGKYGGENLKKMRKID